MRKSVVVGLCIMLCGCQRMATLTESLNLRTKTPEEEQAEAEERELQQRKVEAADRAVASLMTYIESQTRWWGGFTPHQGLTPRDPWDKHLRVSYTQDMLVQVAEVRSSGPDGELHTDDDLVRTHSRPHPLGSGLVHFWLGCSAVAIPVFWLYVLFGHRRRLHRYTPLRFAGVTLLALIVGPLALLVYGVSFLATIFGSGFDFDPFDLDFNIDLDFD